jgi:hypothetical protein
MSPPLLDGFTLACVVAADLTKSANLADFSMWGCKSRTLNRMPSPPMR